MRTTIRIGFSVVVVALGVAAPAVCAAVGPIVRLWPGDPPATQPYDGTDRLTYHRNDPNPASLSNVQHPSLAVYLPGRTTAATSAVVVCPGGGYSGEAVTHEGTRVAERLAADGIAAFVLRYRLPDGHTPAADALPVPQEDVLRAIQIVRGRAAEWQVDPRHVGVMGFSAGGHLAATAATLYDDAPLIAAKAGNDAVSKVSARPDFAVLVYPVITMDATNTHTGSRKSLIGMNPDAATQQRFSTELHVTPQTPPLWIVCAEDDKTVPPVNSRMMDAAAQKQGVPHVLTVIPIGGHGFGLGQPDAETGKWFDACLAWLRDQKLISPKA